MNFWGMQSKVRCYRTLIGLAVVLLLAAGCGSSDSTQPVATTASTPPYASPGPHVVGETTIALGVSAPKYGERYATVFYPTNLTSSEAAKLPKFSYTQADTLPAVFRHLLPAKYNLTTTVNAYPNAPGSSAGPYPVVLFDFGASGQRLFYSNLLSGIASWGYVVVAADYFEHSIAAQVMTAGAKEAPTPPTRAEQSRGAALDLSVMLTSLSAVEKASDDPMLVLHGTVNPNRVTAIGHSAGGETAFDSLHSPRVTTAIGWSPVGPLGPPSKKPVMIIHPVGDDVVTAALVDDEYAAFPGPKSSVEPSAGGHNTYTDTCVVIRNGGGLIQYAIAAHFVTAKLARLGFNGCSPHNVAPARFWRVVQYYTVFQLKAYLGHGSTTVPHPAPGAFPGIEVSVAQKK